MTILTVLHGQELGWICLGSCTTDVVVNAMVLFWLTRRGNVSDEAASGGHPGNHVPGYNNRSENGKGMGSGALQMHRISVTPGTHVAGATGSFTGTSSINGMSKASTGIQASAKMDEASRSAMKVNFSGYSNAGVYDGSQPYTRDGLSPSVDDKSVVLPDTPTSVGFVYEKKVTMGGNTSSPAGFFNKLIGRRSPMEGGQRSFNSTRSAFGGRNRRGSVTEDTGVRITITTMLENDDTPTINAAQARDSNRSSKEQTMMGPSHAV
jgi:hypothetical protein